LQNTTTLYNVSQVGMIQTDGGTYHNTSCPSVVVNCPYAAVAAIYTA